MVLAVLGLVGVSDTYQLNVSEVLKLPGRTEGIEDKGSLHTQPNLLLRFQTSFIKRNLPADPRCSAQSVRDVLGLLRTNRTIVKIEQVTNKCTTKKIDVIVFSNVEDEVSISVKKIKDIEDKTTIIF
uniref:ACT domain-containing protein n=1 Tax=Caenorhabditis tropicalis TaxID=1561998 RepID=A0A1I7TPG5_9PELO